MATRLPAADPRLSDSSSADADSTSSALTPASSDPPSSTAFPSSRRRAAPTPTPMPAAGASVTAFLDDASEEDVFNTRKKRARRGSQDPIAPASQDPFLPEPVGLSMSSKIKAAKAKPIVNDPPAAHLPSSSISLPSPPARGAQAETFPPPLVAFPPPKRSAAAASSKARSREPDRAGEAGPSGKKARRRPAGVDGGDEDVEEGLEAGARLMDEVSNERGRRSKLVGRRPPATLKFLDFPPRPPSPPAAGSSSSRTKTAPVIPPLASTSSSKHFSLQPPRTPSSLPQQQHDQDASGDSLVPLQISDTPMIRKNQEMRANVSKRKSSFGLRGQRASASFGKGEATAPHAAVPPESFYKHIDRDLPPAVQMRHLLVFLGKRVGPPSALAAPSAAATATTAADAKGKGKSTTADEGSRTAKGAAIADEIIEETLRQIMRAKVDTNPSSSSGVHPFQLPSRPTRPHPGNVLNRKAQEEGERIIRQGQEEEARWSAAVKAANALQTRTCEALAHKIARLDLADAGEVDEQALDDEAEREAARLAMGVLRRSEEPPMTLPDDLEFQIDLLRQTTTTAVQFSLESTRILDGTFATLATRLRARDVLLPSEATPSSFPSAAAAAGLGLTSSDSRPSSKEDPMGMLRALAARSHSPSTSFGSTPAPPTSAAPPTTPAPPPQTPGRRGLLGAAGAQTPSRRGTGVTPHRARTPGGEGAA